MVLINCKDGIINIGIMISNVEISGQTQSLTVWNELALHK